MENHMLTIDNRAKLTVTAVTDVDSFNEQNILIKLVQGGLVLKGERLHIEKLDLAEGKVIITGDVQSVVYTKKRDKEESSFLKKILK